jgi:hypothetical protein
MRKSTDVDAFLRARVLPEFLPIAARIRALMREHSREVTELMSYGMPCYLAKSILAYIIPNKKGITFGFPRGKQMEDKYGLLRGGGKASRHLELRTLEAANRSMLRYYIKQALELDAR